MRAGATRVVRKLLWRLTLALLLSCPMTVMAGSAACDSPRRVITLGVPPWLSGPAAKMWIRGLHDQVLRETCFDLRISTESDFSEHVAATVRGKHQLLIAPTHVGMLLVQHYGFRLLGVEPAGQAAMVLFVAADSALREIHELQGCTVALPDPLALVSLAARYRLAQGGIQPRYVYFPRHDHVPAEVDAGRVDAGAVYDPVLRARRVQGRGTRVLLQLLPPEVPLGVLVVRRDVAPEVATALLKAMAGYQPPKDSLEVAIHPAQSGDEARLARQMAPFVRMLQQELEAMTQP